MELLAWERMICGPRIFGKQAEDWPPVPVPFHCVLSELFAPKARPVCVWRRRNLARMPHFGRAVTKIGVWHRAESVNCDRIVYRIGVGLEKSSGPRPRTRSSQKG